MAKLFNTQLRPLSVSITYLDNNKVLRADRIRCIPGKDVELSVKQLKALRESDGFNQFVKDGWLRVSSEEETAADKIAEAVTISDAAQELADAEGLDLNTVKPNGANKITVDVVRKALKASDEL